MPADVIALEISPLTERHHTGIANVTKSLVREMLADSSIETRFILNRSEIPEDVVRACLTEEGGEILWWLSGRMPTPLTYDLNCRIVGLYPGHKWHRRLFPYEVQIVHDLTTLLAPQFHTEESAKFWQERQLGDLLSSDLIVAVSQSTLDDIHTYYPHTRDIPAVVAPLAPMAFADAAEVPAEPYVVVLGTIEPRKNAAVILAALARHPILLDKLRFVFVGRQGWSVDADALIEQHGLAQAVEEGRILFTGFTSDIVRDALIRSARCVLYVSHYEGFGLPVLESLAQGTPVITGFGSSLPEAGGPEAVYCDVEDPEAILAALHAVLDNPGPRASRLAWAHQFSWTKTWITIRDAMLSGS